MAAIKGETQARFQAKTLPTPAAHPSAGGNTFFQQTGPRPLSTAPAPINRQPGGAFVRSLPKPTGGSGLGGVFHAIGHALTSSPRDVYRFQNGRPVPIKQPSLLTQVGNASGYSQIAPIVAHPMRFVQQQRAKSPQGKANSALLMTLLGAGFGGGAPADAALTRAYSVGGGKQLNPALRAGLLRLRDLQPTEAENVVAGSKLGIAHHGTPFPFGRDQILPHADDPAAVQTLHLSPDKQMAQRFAATKANALGAEPVGPYEMNNGLWQHIRDRTPAHADSGPSSIDLQLMNALSQNPGAKLARDLQLPNGEPFLAPRVHSFFVDARNPIHLQDVPNPGAVELLREYLGNRAAMGGSAWQDFANLGDRLDQHKSYESLFGDLQKTLGNTIGERVAGNDIRAHDVRYWLTNMLQHSIGADAVVGRSGNIQVSSPLNLWDPGIVKEAQATKNLRATAAQILAADAKGQPANLNPKLAAAFAQAIRDGKVGPLRERIVLKNLLDSPGAGTPYYRGVASVYKKESPKFWNEQSLHGPGAYHTDSRQVADSYVGATNGDAREGGNVRINAVVPGAHGLLNLDKEMSGDQILAIRDALGPVVQRLFNRRWSPNHPAGSSMGERAAADFMSAMKEGGMGGRDNPTGGELRDWLDYHHGPDAARQILVKAGFNTLEHTGGRVIGGMGDHNVRIALKPSRTMPYFQARQLVQGYGKALKALRAASGMDGASAEEKAQYLRSYAQTFAQEMETRNRSNGSFMQPVNAEMLRTLREARYRYPEIKREFGNEGVMLVARAMHSGQFSDWPEVQRVVGNLIANEPRIPQTTISTGAAAMREQERRRTLLVQSLRKVLAQRHSDKLTDIFFGGFPY